MRRRRFAWMGALLASIASQAIAKPPSRPIDLIPGDMLAAIEFRQPDEQVQGLRDLITSWQLKGTPLQEMIAASDELREGRTGLVALSAGIGLEPWEAIKALVGRDLAIGLAPGDDDQPRIILATFPRDRQPVERMVAAVRLFAGKAEPLIYRNETILSLGDALSVCLLDDALLVSNDTGLVKRAIDLAHGRGQSLPRANWYRKAEKLWPASADVRWTINAQALRAIVGPMGLPEKLAEPGSAYLIGGWYAHLRQAELITGWATSVDGAWRLDLAIDSPKTLPAQFDGFAPAQFERPRWRADTIAGFAGEIRLARDWADLIAEREALLTLAGVTEVANATTTLATITGGMDPVEDLYAHLQGPTRVILARQEFTNERAIPSPRLPAFAVTMPLGAGEDSELAQRLRSAGQIALALIAVNQGEEQTAMMMIDSQRYAGQRVLFGVYAAPYQDSDDAPVRVGQEYNYEPSVAIVRGELVIASTRALMHEIIDAIGRNEAPADDLPATGDVLRLRADPIARMLDDNLDELVAQRMLEKDADRATATRDIEALIQLVDLFDDAELRSTMTARGARASLTIRPAPVASPASEPAR